MKTFLGIAVLILVGLGLTLSAHGPTFPPDPCDTDPSPCGPPMPAPPPGPKCPPMPPAWCGGQNDADAMVIGVNFGGIYIPF